MKIIPKMRFSFFIIALFLLAGCTQTVTRERLRSMAFQNQGQTFPNSTTYTGSDDHYDYFVIRRFVGGETSYRVARSEETVRNRFVRGDKHSKARDIGVGNFEEIKFMPVDSASPNKGKVRKGHYVDGQIVWEDEEPPAK